MWPWLSVGNFTIPSFLLVQSLNAVLILVWARRRSVMLDLPPRRALDLVVVVLVAGLLGGRLLHVLWEAPRFYFENPGAIFHLLSGGYVYYGGLLTGILAGITLLRWTDETEWGRWMDFAAPLASLGTALGRLGCLLAGCCYGKVCFLPWALPFTDERGLSLLRHPTQIYSFLWEIGTLCLLLGLEKVNPKRRPSWLRPAGSLFGLWLIFHSVGRFLIEFVRDDFRGPEWGLSISQWLSLCAFIGGCLLLRHLSREASVLARQMPR